MPQTELIQDANGNFLGHVVTSDDGTQKRILRIDNCHKCGKRADYNAPAVDPDLGLQQSPIWCDPCAHKEQGIFLLSIDQCTIDGERAWSKSCWAAYYDDVVLHISKDFIPESAWFLGHIHIPKLSEKWDTFNKALGCCFDDPQRRLKAFMMELSAFRKSGAHWCTSCNKPMLQTEIAGRPLFTGAVCAPCWKLHQEHLEEQRKAGHVCRMCGRPWGDCCC